MQRAALILAIATLSALASVYGLRTIGAGEPEAAPVEQAASLTEVDAPSAPGGAASVRKAADGHYWAEAQVEGRRVRFMVDTGASSVALTEADARRLGLTSELSFDQPVATAGGRVMAARVMLDYVSVSGARVEDVEALVVREGLETSLLGMTYLGRLSRFEATRDSLILRR